MKRSEEEEVKEEEEEEEAEVKRERGCEESRVAVRPRMGTLLKDHLLFYYSIY